ncbi:MAG: peptidylprolyl isomerase [Chitinivibrionales bacterium]
MLFRNKVRAIGLCMALFVISSFSMEKADGIAAVIGDSVILLSELDAYTVVRLSNMGQKPDSATVPKMRKQFLSELIDGKILIVHAAKDTNIIIKESEIEQAQNNQVQTILQQNSITLPVLEQELKEKYGMSLAKFKAQMRMQIQEQLVRQKVQQFYVSSLPPSRKDIQAFYDTYQDSLPLLGESVLLSKIFIHVSPSDSARQIAFGKISGIKRRLNNGDDFAAVAKQYSDDPNAENGGDLGFIKKGTLSELNFEEKAFSLSPGQVSDIFESRLGFHVIAVVEKKDQMVHVRQIFVKVAPSEDVLQKTSALLDSIKTNCKNKADFIAAVKQWSTDDQTKAASGQTGWSSLYELPEKIKSAIDSLKAGEISAPVRDGNDFTLYRVDDRKAQRKLTLEDDYNLLADKTHEITMQKKLFDLVKKWRQDVFVEERL